ncbi:transcription termination/antitermination protein NusG [Methylobacterium oxalidis]|uniref:transcription termination/antitermination protein NusG n=1 Tax=Methylobacterium oxalidis TaxID=944322 RepID=UPI00331599B3
MGKRGTNGTHMRFEPRRAIDPALTWFVVQAEPMAEAKAEEDLRAHSIDVWVPRFKAVTVRRKRKVEVEQMFFPRYLFVGLDRAQHAGRWTSLLFDCDHVSDVLGVDGPLAMPATVLQIIADRLTGDVKSERLAVAAAFRVGEMRTVAQGPFASFMAEVTELLANGRIRADVHIFGRPTPVEFDPAWLGPA